MAKKKELQIISCETLKQLAEKTSKEGRITANAKKHGRDTRWSGRVPMLLPVSVACSEANPDKAERGDYYFFISFNVPGIPVWEPGFVEFPKAELKVRMNKDMTFFCFGNSQISKAENIVSRIRRIYKSLDPSNPVKKQIEEAFKEERVKLL